MPYKETITQEYLKHVLSYDPETGDFRWLVRLSKNVPVGRLAGRSNGAKGHRYVRIADVEYSAPRLAWLYVHGKWPAKLWFKDGDPSNIRITNLAERKSLPKKYDHLTPEGRIEYLKEHRARFAEHYRNNQRLKKFGLSNDDYQKKHDAQKGACAICGKSETTKRNGNLVCLSIDHHHASGKVRDLLCSACNRLIGVAKEDISVLEAAIVYLRRHNE